MSMWFSHKLSYKTAGCLKGKAHPGCIPQYLLRDSGNHSQLVGVPGSYVTTKALFFELWLKVGSHWCLLYLHLNPDRFWKVGCKLLSLMWSFPKIFGVAMRAPYNLYPSINTTALRWVCVSGSVGTHCRSPGF